MQAIQFIQTTPEQLQEQITAGVKFELQVFLKEIQLSKPSEYITRADTAKLFDVDLATIHNWSKKGILNPVGIGGRIYFLREEVENSVKPIYGETELRQKR